MGSRAKRRLAQAIIYALLIAAAVVMLFPIAWMVTVSVRPNIEVMKIPPDWIPQFFTLDAYRKVLESPRYLRTFVNTYFVALVVTFLSLVVGLYTFLLAWNEFLFAVVLIEAWEKRVITMAIYSLLAEFVTEWSMMMAYSVLASAPLVLAFVFLQRYMVRGMTAGAVTQ